MAPTDGLDIAAVQLFFKIMQIVVDTAEMNKLQLP